jgi:HAD superfamily hydrolase (TIGR01509 family)
MIKGAIYDMDDLMINSIRIHVKAFDILGERHNFKMSDIDEETQRGFVGIRIHDITAIIVEKLGLQENVDDLYHERQKIFIDLIRDEVEPMPGLFKALDVVKKLNLKTSIASSATMEYIDIVLDKLNIRNYFDEIVCGDDVSKGKPDPETYQVAAKKLDLKPKECVVFEDAEKGIAAAKDAGCKCIAVKNPYTPPQNLSRADRIITTLKEVTENLLSSL